MFQYAVHTYSPALLKQYIVIPTYTLSPGGRGRRWQNWSGSPFSWPLDTLPSLGWSAPSESHPSWNTQSEPTLTSNMTCCFCCLVHSLLIYRATKEVKWNVGDLTMCISAVHWRERCREQIHLLCGVGHCWWWILAAEGGRSAAPNTRI